MAKGKGKAKSSRGTKARKSSKKNKNSRIKFGIKLVLAGTLLVCLFVILKYGAMVLRYKEYSAELVSDREAFKKRYASVYPEAKLHPFYFYIQFEPYPRNTNPLLRLSLQ